MQQPQLVAKVIPKSGIIDCTNFKAILTEVECLERVGGTLNITHFYGAFEDQKSIYLLLEHCIGGAINPTKLWKKKDTRNHLKAHMKDIIHSVALCHSLNILHRDLKIDNFLFADSSADAPIKLCDFGGAVIINGEEKETVNLKTVLGTPMYTAPEVLRHSYSYPADIWSIGIILYKLLYNKYPFTAGALLNEQILYSPIKFTEEDASTAAIDLLKRLLDRNAATRITAADALNHPWLAENITKPSAAELSSPLPSNDLSEVVSGSILQRLQLYRTLNSLQLLIFYLITRVLSDNNPVKRPWLALFKENQDSLTTANSLQKALKDGGYNITSGEVSMLLSRVNLSHTGVITSDEFVSSLIDWKALQSPDDTFSWTATVAQVFQSLDADDDGLISVPDILSAISGTMQHTSSSWYYTLQEEVSVAFLMANSGSDGFMTLDELLAAITVTSDFSMYVSRYSNQSKTL